jgi:hypothetical protein
MFEIVQRDNELCPENPWDRTANYKFTFYDFITGESKNDVRYITEVLNA